MPLDPRLAQEIIAAVDARFEQLQRAQPYTAYGVVSAVDTTNRKATVKLSGDTVGSAGFVYPAWLEPAVDDAVRVVVDPRGDRYIAQVYGYPSLAADTAAFLEDGDLSGDWLLTSHGASVRSALYIRATAGQAALVAISHIGDTASKAIYDTSSIEWGDGSAARDVRLERVSANVLGTGAGDSLAIGGSGAGNTAAGILLGATGTVEIAANGGTPYIDLKNDLGGTDFDARIILNSNDMLSIEGITRFQIGTGAVEITIGHFDVDTERGAIYHDGQTGNLGNYLAGVGGAYAPALKWGANATAPLLGFYGTAAVVRQAWSAPTTTVDRTAFSDSVTLAELAQRVGTLIADLRTYGLLG